MKKVFLTIFLSIFLFSCGNNQEKIKNNEIQTGKISTGNIEKEAEKEMLETNLKISTDLVTNFPVDSLNLHLSLFLKPSHQFLFLKKSFKEKDILRYKKDLDDKKSEILKEFPEIEKNLTDSEKSIPGFDLGVMFQAFTSLDTKENPGNKLTVKVDGEYNQDFKGNIYNFPFYQYYGIGRQEIMMYSEILFAKNTGKNTYSIEKTEEELVDFFDEKSLMTGYVGSSNHTFEKIPEKINIDLSSVSEIYKKYLGKEENKAIFSFSIFDNLKDIEKIEADGKKVDLNDKNIYSCEDSSNSENKYCDLDLLKISENDFPKKLTIYLK